MKRLMMMLALAAPMAVLSVDAYAATATAAVNNVPEANPQVVVQSAIDSLTARLIKDKKQLQRDPAAMNAVVEQNIAPFVDVPGIARGVMGQYFRQATDAQRDRFTTVFRDSITRTYANGLASYNNEKIVVKPYKPGDDANRAQVDVDMTLSNGNIIPVLFQMQRDGQGVWKARNLIINGLNLGLTFRKRFADVVGQANGNIDKAIDLWSPGPVEAIKGKS